MPFAKAKVKVWGIRASVTNRDLDSQIIVWDDENIPSGSFGTARNLTDDVKTQIFNAKGSASVDGQLEMILPEPISLRRGTSVATENIQSGTIMLYIA